MKTLKTILLDAILRGGICLSLLLICSISYGQSCADGSSSYTDDILPILSAKCGGCHTTSSTSGFNLTTYAGLLAGGTNCGAGVTPGITAASSIIDKTQWANGGASATCGNNMPTSGTPLTAAESMLIDAWIAAGAQENCPSGTNLACSGTGGLSITEILADPNSGTANLDANCDGVADAGDDYLIICNDSAADIDISGYEVYDNAGLAFTFPAGTILPAGECAVVVDTWPAASGPIPPNVFAGGPAINNGGDQVILYDPATTTYQSVLFNGFALDTSVLPAGATTACDEDWGSDTDGMALTNAGPGPDSLPYECMTPTCTVMNVTVTADGACAGDDATYTVCADVAGGSGDYDLIDATSSAVLSSLTGQADGNICYTVTVTGPTTATTIDVDVVDNMDATCLSGTPATVTIPVCPAVMAMCETLVITEVMYDPCSGGAGTDDCMGGAGTYWDDEGNGEWVEIYNYGPDPVDVSGYLIGDSAAGDVYEIPAGTIIQPGDYLVIGQPAIIACMQAAGINAVVGCAPGNCPTSIAGPRFNNGGDDVELKDPTGGLCDLISYDGTDCSGNNDGYTYSLIADPATFVDGTENDAATAYGVSLNGGDAGSFGGGSPGVVNTLGSCVTNLAEAITATCNGTDAVFDISFDYTEGNVTDYDIYIDGVLNTTLTGYPTGDQTGQTGTITIPNSTTATSITIEIRPTGADENICFEETITVDIPACTAACAIAADLMTAPAAPVVVESTCQADGTTVDGGSIAAITCPTDATAEYSIDGGTTWTTTVPTYDQTNPVTVTVRCLCDEDMTTASPTAEVTTVPGMCPVCAIAADLMTAPAAPVITESTCQADGTTVDGGSIAAITCPTDATAEYSIDGGTTWTTTVPTYDQTNPITVTVRCLCDEDMTTASPTAEVTTVPGMCIPMTCEITGLTVVPTACDPADDTYDLDIDFTVTDPGASGMFNVDVCGTAYGPFAYSALPINIPGLTADGTVGCTVTVTDVDNTGGGTGGTVVPTAADDVFVSFVPDGLGAGGGVDECDGESVTIHNFATDASGACVTIDISGFTLTDNVGEFYTFPAGTTIPPGGSLTLTSTQMIGPCSGTAGMGDGGGSQFSNSNDNALLSDAGGAAIDDTGLVDGDPGTEYESPALTAAGGAGSSTCTGGVACEAAMPYDAPVSCMVMCPTDIAGMLGADAMVCSDDPATDLMIAITGSGTGPYTVVYDDGTGNQVVMNYNDGDAISVSPGVTTTYTLISITDANGCTGTVSGTALITVDDPPNAGIAGTAMACSNAADGNTIVDLDGSLTGTPDAAGVWTETTSSGVSLATTTAVDFNGVMPGMYTFTYTVPGPGLCEDAMADVVVTVADCSVPCPTIDANIAADDTVCADNTASTLTITITGGTGPYTIMYSDGTTQTITGYNSGDAIPVSPTATTTYTLTGAMDVDMCPATLGTTDVTITVVDLPVAGTTTPAMACNDSTEGVSVVDLGATLSGADAGGTWTETTASGVSLADPTMVDFNGATVGTYTFVYTVAATAPCTTDATVSVDIMVTDCAVPGCTLVLSPETVACDAETTGIDTYTVSIPFDNGAEGFPGGMNYTVTSSGTIGGDNPMIVQSGTITITFTEGSAYDYSIQGTAGNPNELCDFSISGASEICEPMVCEDEIAGMIIGDTSCDLSGITVTITDAAGTVITTLTTDAAGIYDSSPAVFPCGDYFAELTAGVPVCYGDGEIGPKPFVIDGDTSMTDTDGPNFGTIASIPTVGEWGLIILALLMCIVAVAGIKERNIAIAKK